MPSTALFLFPRFLDCPPPDVQVVRRSLMVSFALMYPGFGCVLVHSCCGSNQQDETARRAENDAILEYGNHASGKKKSEALTKVLLKDASRGYSLPITFDCAKSIKHSRISPMGVAHQWGIDAHGDLIPKDRLTHDQSFSPVGNRRSRRSHSKRQIDP